MMNDVEREESKGPFGAASSDPRTGYCQECGLPLTASSTRRVGNGVFCSSCAAHRHSTPPWQAVNNGPATDGRTGTGAQGYTAQPRPGAAAVLGLIPGVGAMYNGQYAKGAMHLGVFVALLALADNVSWVFNWLVCGWIFYQAFDAYHTAQARRAGQPLPDPFGWNDLGTRFAGTSAPRSPERFPSAVPYAEAPAPPRQTQDWAPPPARGGSSADTASDPFSASASFHGDNPYNAPFSSAPPPPAPPPGVRPATQVPYSPTYSASDIRSPEMPPPLVGTKRFPSGALWLIGLGLIFFAGNLLPSLRLSGRWMAPLALVALACWIALHRWTQQQRAGRSTFRFDQSLMRILSFPLMLLTVASLLALQSASLVSLARSWPLLLVVWGGLQVAQRMTAPPAALPPEATSSTYSHSENHLTRL